MLENAKQNHSPFQKIAVIGLGFVGLPLALLFAKKGFDVTGIDVDERKVNSILKQSSYIPDITDEEIKKVVTAGKFSAKNHYQAAQEADVIIICVPTPLTTSHTPDLSYLTAVGNSLVPYLQKGQLVILESSTYPGTTREVLMPILEKSGLKAGKDFFLAYSPERIDPGNKKFPVEAIPKVISGLTDACQEQISHLYSQIYDQVVAVSSPETAELTKLLENTFRFINISFINEMAILCDKLHLDVWEVIDAASTKPYGFTAFYPGPGIGGHCIPVDPLYLQWAAEQKGTASQFIDISNRLNQNIINYIVEQINTLFPQKQANILIYGAAYKKDLNDARESSIFPIIEKLHEARHHVSYHDPFIPEITVHHDKLSSVPLTDEQLQQADCVLLLTDHSNIPLQRIVNQAKLIYDTRNITANVLGQSSKIIRMGGGLI